MSETRWSARIEAICPVAKCLPSIIAALDCIIKPNKLSNEALSEAKGLKSYFKSFTAIVLATFWVKVLQSFKERNLLLQSAGISLDTEAANVADLQEEMQVFRNEWNGIISEARIVTNSMEVVPEFNSKINWQRKCKRFHNESPDEATSESAEAIFRNMVFYVAMENIINELNFWKRYKLEMSPLKKCIMGKNVLISSSIRGLLPRNITAKWSIKKDNGYFKITDSSTPNYESESSPILQTPKCKINHIHGEKDKNTFTSTLTYEPRVEDKGAKFICTFFDKDKEIAKNNTTSIEIFAKPEVSIIRESPVSGKDEVKFTVNVNKFYPKDIVIEWYHKGKPVKHDLVEPDTNADKTYRTTREITLPEGELQAGDKIQVAIKHSSMKTAVTKEATAKDPAERRQYTVEEVVMPQSVTVGESVTLTCVMIGPLIEEAKTRWRIHTADEKTKLEEGCRNLQRVEYKTNWNT
nr:PREDICTED: uncharacterized protein LOC106705977 [Latimeria chalumnae]|eukprot:XP_014351704.1 PREDICTED: uncharacterized protein LOC106705977 [Latimeria chalumnae]